MNRQRRALITGVGGQDGSLLAELLLAEGYEVFGVVRRSPEVYAGTLGPIADRLTVLRADLLDQGSLAAALRAARPSEVYNLAAPSFVPRSWDEPVQTAEFAAVGVTAMLEAIRDVDSTIRFYQASSSEIFGEPIEGDGIVLMRTLVPIGRFGRMPPGIFTDVHAHIQPGKLDRCRFGGGKEIPPFIEDVIIRQQDFLHRADNRPAMQQAHAVRHAAFRHSLGIGMPNQHAQIWIEFLRQFFDRAAASGGETFAEQQVLGGIAGDDQFRRDQQVSTVSNSALSRLFNESRISGQIADRGIELCNRNFHRCFYRRR